MHDHEPPPLSPQALEAWQKRGLIETSSEPTKPSDQWGTPPQIVELVRSVLGTIDLDPCSSEEFNKTVKAKHYISEGGDRSLFWSEPGDPPQSIFINPPNGRGLPLRFWHILINERNNGRLTHAIFLAFNAEFLRTAQAHCFKPTSFTFCIPRKRISFVDRRGTEVEKREAPRYFNAIIYVPGVVDKTQNFIDVFRSVGAVIPRGHA